MSVLVVRSKIRNLYCLRPYRTAQYDCDCRIETAVWSFTIYVKWGRDYFIFLFRNSAYKYNGSV